MTVLRTDLVALSLGVLLIGVTGCRWRAADDFQEELRCGMSAAEIESLARRFGVESFRPLGEPHSPNPHVTHVLDEGSTFFEFFVGAEGLETVLQGAYVGLTTGIDSEPRVNLCTGEIIGSLLLTIKGSQALGGAEILVDGERRGWLSKVPEYQMSIGLSSGPHQIRIEQEGYEPIVIPVDYEPYIREDQIVLPPPISKGSRDSP